MHYKIKKKTKTTKKQQQQQMKRYFLNGEFGGTSKQRHDQNTPYSPTGLEKERKRIFCF